MKYMNYFLLFIISLLAACDSSEVREAKKEISDAMRDPRSTEFRNVKSFSLDTRMMVCGEVNGKNAFGAMAGYQRFLYYSPLIRVSKNSRDNLAIYQCCKFLESSGTKGDAKTTTDIKECADIEPPMILF